MPKCAVCNDSEWIPLDDDPTTMTPCPACFMIRRVERLQSICGLNETERRVTLAAIDASGHDTDRMIEAALLFIANPSNMLTIYGSCGNAKTMVLQAIVNACLVRGIGAIYATFYDMVQYVREAYQPESSESAWRRIKRLQGTPVLCIDEMDKVKSTDWVREVETQLIDARYRDAIAGKRGTVLAMNGHPSQLSKHLYSRLRDGRNVIIENRDPDLRAMIK